MKKTLYILLLLLALHGFAQQTDRFGATQGNYGTVHKPQNKSYLSQNEAELFKGITGSKVPKTVYEERIMNKLIRTRLTRKEAKVWTKKEVLGQQLSGFETVYYWSAKRKVKKRAKILNKFQIDTTRFKSRTTAQLTPSEQRVLQKAQDTSSVLSPQEQKILKRALKKKKKIRRQQERYTITEEDKMLLEKKHNDSVKLTLKDKYKLWQVERKKKRIQKRKLEEAAASGAWTPVKVRKTPKVWTNLTMGSKKRPSKYMRKYQHYQKKYKLTPEEKEALNKANGGVALTAKDRVLAARAQKKQWKYKYKVEKLKEKYYLKLQNKQTRKHLKQKKRKINADRRKKMRQLRWKQFKQYVKNLF